MKWIFLIFTIVISCSSGLDFKRWCPSVRNDIKKCSKDFIDSPDLAKKFRNPAKILNPKALMSEMMSVICEESTKLQFEKFYRCLLEIIFDCIPPDWIKVFPGVDNVIESIEYMCDNVDDVDLPCLNKKLFRQTRCVHDKLADVNPDMSTSEGFLEYTCSYYSVFNSCSRSAFAECGNRTSEVVSKVYEYQTPVGCNACMFGPSWIILICLLLTLCVDKRMTSILC